MVSELNTLSRKIRADIVRMSHEGQAAHLGSSLSCVDLLVSAYWSALRLGPHDWTDPARDRLILSKGHAAAAWYATLARRGYFPRSALATFNRPGSGLPEQPCPRSMPGVEVATGSLGHGLPIGIGLALAARIQGHSSRILVIMSDGECNEGSVWEGAMFAAARQLGCLSIVVDYNRWQATGRSQEIMALEPFAEKWRSFGWQTQEVDGHDVDLLQTIWNEQARSRARVGIPTAIIAHTIKGRGFSFMEDDNNWHYRIPNREELARALAELNIEIEPWDERHA